MAGQSLPLELPSDSSVLGAKLAVKRKLQMPQSCQQLLLGTSTLRNDELLSTLACGQPLCLTLVVTLAPLLAELEGGAEPARLRALADLRRLGVRGGGEAAVRAVVTRFGDESSEVRGAAAETLGKIVQRGDEGATAEVVRSLSAGGAVPERRLAAVAALVEVAERGDSLVVPALAQCLEDDCWKIRLAAVGALTELAGPGDASAAARRLRHSSWEVRQSALEALAQIAHRGDAASAAAVLGVLEDESDARVRRAAVRALASLCEHGDLQVVATVTAMLEDASWEVRWEAADALGRVARRGDKAAITAVTSRLQDSDADVRRAAVDTLRLLHPERGSRRSSSGIRRGFADASGVAAEDRFRATFTC